MKKRMKSFNLMFVSLLIGVFLVGGVSGLTLISDCQGLQNMNNDLTEDYELTGDIDCSGFGDFEDIGDGFGSWFEGTFDGKGFVIDGLYIGMGSGLFVATDWGVEIKNVGLTNVDITGSYGVGAFTGTNYGDITNCYSTGSVVSEENAGGGLVGMNDGTIINCYFAGTVDGPDSDAGGLVGNNGVTGTIINSYSTASMLDDGGGLVGMNSGTCTNSFWNPTDAGVSTSDCGTESTQADMKKESTFTGWDFSSIWKIQEDVSYPYLNPRCSPDQTIMKLFQDTNSHGALWDYTGSGDLNLFGEEVTSTGQVGISNRIFGDVYIAPRTGDIESISIVIDSSEPWDSGELIKCAIYGESRTLIEGTLARDGGSGLFGVQTFNLQSLVSVTGGEEYSLVCWSNSGLGNLRVEIIPVPLREYPFYWKDVTYGSWPNPLSPPNNYDGSNILIWADYTDHVEPIPGYDVDICYSGTAPGTPHPACDETNSFLWLSADYNSHVSTTQTAEYNIGVCYEGLTCVAETHTGTESCDDGSEPIASLYQLTNSHIGKGNVDDYDIKICCGAGPVIPAGTVYWADMNGVPITSAEIGDSVMMVYEDAGSNYDFEVWEDDLFYGEGIGDDEIKTGISSFLKNGDAIGIWEITQEDILKANPTTEIGAYEFYFKIKGEVVSSENYLIVNKDSYDNTIPTTQITAPPNETNYVIPSGASETDSIDFTQLSQDEDDDLGILWEFGDGESESFSNCLTSETCDTTHAYSSKGTNRIKLTASEMTRNQKASDTSKVYIYTSGINVFSIIEETTSGRVVTINMNKAHVSFCAYAEVVCEADYNSNPHLNTCTQVMGELGNQIWCYDRELKIKGLEGDSTYGFSGEPNIMLIWEFDGVEGVEDLRNGLEFIKVFNQAGEHDINLMMAYNSASP